MSTSLFAERILDFIQAKGYRPQQLDELARALGVGAEEHGDFHAACKALMKTGRIVHGARNALVLADPPGTLTGVFRGNARGFGFVVPDTPNAHGDLYIPGGATGGAITGDRVSARVFKRGKRDGKMMHEGRILNVITRGRNRFVGELQRQVARWLVIPDGNVLHVPIAVADPSAKDARPGDQVVVEIIQYPSEHQEARGVILKVLGKRGEPDVDTLSIIEQYQLPEEFDAAVLEQAREAVTSYDVAAARDREDLSGETIITIDPADARDFDDAISLTERENGLIELGVHIADVAHFVPVNTPLDVEARARSNSIYLPRTVIPMLPEVLSNGVCSLQEREPRLTKSAFLTYDRKGMVRGARFTNTIIRSSKRLTYEQAGAILAGKSGRISAKIVALLRRMERLARTIRDRRIREGMLVLDLREIDMVYDAEGRVIDVRPADTGFSHTIIEMFMVEANEAVARLMVEHHVPALRRVHAEPDESTGSHLKRFLKVLGYELPKDADRFALQAILDQVRGKPESFAVNLAILRSMQQAEYSPKRIGHYALASKHYCHFTSPIRRYPDLTVHRLLDLFIRTPLPFGGEGRVRGNESSSSGSDSIPSEETLSELGALCSANERRAEAAERELTLVLVLRLLENHLGEEFEGIVTGVANVGVFVQLERFLVDGLLRFRDILDDWWELDPSHGMVIGQRSGRRITVGDRLKVVIGKINLPARQLELALAAPLKATRGARGAKTSKTREPSTSDRGPRRLQPRRSRSGSKDGAPRSQKRPPRRR